MKSAATSPLPRPVLTSICQAIAVLEGLGGIGIGIAGAMEDPKALPYAVAIVAASLALAAIHYGIGQVAEYLAQSAHYARLAYEERKPAVVSVPAASASAAWAPPPLPGRSEYFVALEGDRVEGPISRDKIDALLKRGMANDDTMVIERGGKEWTRLATLLASAA